MIAAIGHADLARAADSRDDALSLHDGTNAMTIGNPSFPERPVVLLVEDELEMAWEISLALERQGYDVRIVESEHQVLRAVRVHAPEVLIVDRMLYGSDALPTIEILRGNGNKVPVLVISALSSIDDRVTGLRAGGDDYLVKPFAVDELVARVEALRRRASDTRVTILRVGPLTMDLIDRSVRRGDRVLTLLPREFNLLEYFMRRPDQTITRAMLLMDVWHYRNLPQTNVVDVHIGKLRRKVDAAGEPPLIETVRAAGFVLRGDR
jgi:two-component system, OmpR family, response regulator